ncbi:MAG TPA: hypothetical protein VEZ11_02535 [Thermoanaerobaculia bacterium]|nr:hypothetical protein [Thermoanaerobaculia bacterium]
MNDSTRDTVELFLFVFLLIAAAGGVLLGIANIYDVLHGSGSGEWSGLGMLFTFVVDIPIALLAAGAAFFQRVRRRRWTLVIAFAVVIVMPFLGEVARQIRVRQDQERVKRLEEQILKQYKARPAPAR